MREDGVLLGLPFQAGHQIFAWHMHETQGKFQVVGALPGTADHDLFPLGKRGG